LVNIFIFYWDDRVQNDEMNRAQGRSEIFTGFSGKKIYRKRKFRRPRHRLKTILKQLLK
jgi:hypothetical protein